MKKVLLTLLLSAGMFYASFAQTHVTIIGCAHEPTNGMNADSVLLMLSQIRPDVILLELDSALMDANGNFKGRAANASGNEFVASRRYKLQNSGVIFRRFDIIDRSAYYDKHNTFAMESQVSASIDSLYKRNKLDINSMKIISAEYSANQTLNNLSEMNLTLVNSRPYMNLASFREYWIYTKVPEVIAHTPALAKYYDFQKQDGDFWKLRNQTMVGNIGGYIKTFKGKTIVVLTGAMHKYALTDGLAPLQNKLDFKLEELPANGDIVLSANR